MEPKTIRTILRVIGSLCTVGLAVVAKWEVNELGDASAWIGVLAGTATGAFAWALKAPGDERTR